MSLSFTKLFSSITDSSVWCEDSDTKVVWITMLAMADQFGRVSAALPGLAKRSNVSLKSTQRAIDKFLSPDPYSRTKDHEGRRIEIIDGGWRLLNHEHYRDLRSEEDRREQNRQAQARRRKRLCQQSVSISQQSQPRSAQADADADADIRIPEALNTPGFLRVWKEWQGWRMKKKHCKDWRTLWSKQLDQLQAWGEQAAIESLNQSMRNDWQGIFKVKSPTAKQATVNQGANAKTSGISINSIHQANDVIAECRRQMDECMSYVTDDGPPRKVVRPDMLEKYRELKKRVEEVKAMKVDV